MRAVIGLVLMFGLTACAVEGVQQVAVLNGALSVRAPASYCVDMASARSASDTASVLIGRCTSGGGVTAALVTVTVGRTASGGVMLAETGALRAFMASEAGRRALARSGRAEDVVVLESGVVEGRLLLHLQDRLAGDYWRAVVAIKGRLVTVSATGAEGAPLRPEEGRRLVARTLDALIAANGGA